MTCSTAKQTAQYITATFIGWHNAVTNHKSSASNMVCNHAQGNICFLAVSILNACNFTYMLHDILYSIYKEQVIHFLHNASQTFQPHACINIRMLERCIISVSVIFKLCKYQVPKFYITVAFAANTASWRTAAVLLTAVKI